tara:strand:+ start:574 stop:723 length:150 start_codon:yes stop_codon:yes gene_type:complete
MSKIDTFMNDFADSFIKLNEELSKSKKTKTDAKDVDPNAEPIFNEDKGR